MNFLGKGAAALAASIALASAVSVKADPIESNAENIRKLNIMLMVTSLRCRNGESDFQAEYRQFTSAHLSHLNRAGARLKRDMEKRLGARGGKQALDRIAVSIANSYGDGHPWLSCAELKAATLTLSQATGSKDLSLAADELLAIQPGTRWAG